MFFFIEYTGQRGLSTKRPTTVFFWVPRNLSHHIIRLARIGDTVLVTSREMTGRTQTLHAVVAGGRRGKDDSKQNTLAPLILGYKYSSLDYISGDYIITSLGSIDEISHEKRVSELRSLLVTIKITTPTLHLFLRIYLIHSL
jgi:hypothetical protein